MYKQSNLLNASFHVQIVKGAKSNIFTCKLCAWVIFIILFIRLLCDKKKLEFPRVPTAKGSKVQHFHVLAFMCDCTSYADWLFTLIRVTWTYEDLFHFVKILIFCNYSVFDEPHFLRKLQRNLHVFLLINVWWVDIYCT